MIHRTTVGTDIAMIGLWDVQHMRPELKDMSGGEQGEMLEADARSGRLFYIHTSGDGGCDVHIIVDEPVPPHLLVHYKSLNRRFLLRCPSGRVLTDGVEYYAHVREAEEELGTPVQIDAGDYLLQLHELNEAEINEPAHLASVLGAEDFAYLEGRSGPSGLGCGLLVAGVGLLVFQHWVIGLPVLLAGAGLHIYRAWRNHVDDRYQSIKQRLSEYHDQFPLFIFSLEAVDDVEGHEGGWHTLEA
jgi:hypothetical protein